jgi:hypothetical protein
LRALAFKTASSDITNTAFSLYRLLTVPASLFLCSSIDRRAQREREREKEREREREKERERERANLKPRKGVYVKNEGKREKHLWNTPIHLD